MENPFVLNYAPLLVNIPYQDGNLIAAINQIEEDGEISFRIAYQIEGESGAFELSIENKEHYKRGEPSIWSMWDKELNELHKPLVNVIGKQIEIFFKKLI